MLNFLFLQDKSGLLPLSLANCIGFLFSLFGQSDKSGSKIFLKILKFAQNGETFENEKVIIFNNLKNFIYLF